MLSKKIIVILSWVICQAGIAQTTTDTLQGRNLYRPSSPTHKPEQIPEPAVPGAEINNDSQSVLDHAINRCDTATILSTVNIDSILAREAFIHDSIMARETFVRDSLARRKQILDSLKFLQVQLPKYLKALVATYSEQAIITNSPLKIIGDTALSNFTSTNLPLGFNQPYTPWRETIALAPEQINLVTDTVTNTIKSIKTESYEIAFDAYLNNLVLASKHRLLRRQNEQLYKTNIDTVFFDRSGRITSIKRYILYNKAEANYAVGAKMFDYLWQIKNYTYTPAGIISGYQLINYCDRRKVTDAVKVCNAENFDIMYLSDHYQVKRNHQPANPHSDGTFQYYFTPESTLEKVAFKNEKGSETWTTFVETNDEGNVSRYVYQNKGKVSQTLLINYYNDPNAKNKVETISCMFEDDGISYHQVNNTTGKMRTRDRLTMEWSPWK